MDLNNSPAALFHSVTSRNGADILKECTSIPKEMLYYRIIRSILQTLRLYSGYMVPLAREGTQNPSPYREHSPFRHMLRVPRMLRKRVKDDSSVCMTTVHVFFAMLHLQNGHF